MAKMPIFTRKAATPSGGSATPIHELGDVEFETGGYGIEDFVPDRRPLIAHITGRSATGKTRLACTFPGDIDAIIADNNARDSIQQTCLEYGKKFRWTKEDYGVQAVSKAEKMALATMSAEKVKEKYEVVYQRFLSSLCALSSTKGGDTVLIDGMGQIVDLILLRHFGRKERIMPRDRGPVNQDLKDILNEPRSHGKHLVCTWYSKPVWETKVDKDGRETTAPVAGITEMDGGGNDRLEYPAGLIVETLFVRNKLERDAMRSYLSLGSGDERQEMLGKMKVGSFLARIIKCNRNMTLVGNPEGLFFGADVDFPTMAAKIWGEEWDEEKWVGLKGMMGSEVGEG